MSHAPSHPPPPATASSPHLHHGCRPEAAAAYAPSLLQATTGYDAKDTAHSSLRHRRPCRLSPHLAASQSPLKLPIRNRAAIPPCHHRHGWLPCLFPPSIGHIPSLFPRPCRRLIPPWQAISTSTFSPRRRPLARPLSPPLPAISILQITMATTPEATIPPSSLRIHAGWFQASLLAEIHCQARSPPHPSQLPHLAASPLPLCPKPELHYWLSSHLRCRPPPSSLLDLELPSSFPNAAAARIPSPSIHHSRRLSLPSLPYPSLPPLPCCSKKLMPSSTSSPWPDSPVLPEHHRPQATCRSSSTENFHVGGVRESESLRSLGIDQA